MRVRIALPGLIWPAAGLDAILADAPLPGLSRLLAAPRVTRDAPCSLETWLCREFGLDGEPPYAALRLAADGAWPAPDAIEICADPVSLRFAREHLLLDSPDTLAVTDDELSALCEALNASFADIGLFHLAAGKSYLRLAPEHADKLAVSLSPLPEVIARPIAHFQPQGPQARWWAKLANELQVFCHNHAVNQAREERGAAPLNSIWLWGAGSAPQALQAPDPEMAGRHWLLDGLAAHTGLQTRAFDAAAPARWNLLHDLLVPAQQRDMFAWREALLKLEARVFAPLAAQLTSGRLSGLELIAPGDTSLTRLQIEPRASWKFWQRDAKVSDLVSLLSQPTQPEQAA